MPLRNLIAGIHPRLAVVLHDMLMVWIAWIAVSVLRWSFETNPPPVAWFGPEIGFVLAAQGVIFWWTGLYKGLWRFASLPDLWNIAKAAVLGALAIAITLFLYNRLETVPRTVLTVYPLVLAVLLGAPRLLYRYWKTADSISRRARRASACSCSARARRAKRSCAICAARIGIFRWAFSTTMRHCAARACTAFPCSARWISCRRSRAKRPPRCS